VQVLRATVGTAIVAIALAPSASAEELGTSHGFTYVSDAVSVDAGVDATSARARAECPNHTLPIGGGGRLADGGSGSIVSSTFDGTDWFTDGWHDSPAAEELTGYAICADDDRKIHTRTNKNQDNLEVVAEVVRCRAGRVTGGGLKLSNDPTEWYTDRSFPDAGNDQHGGPADGWSNFARHLVETPAKISATIVCMRGVNTVRVKERGDRDTPGPLSVIIGCGGNKVVTGGGYISYGNTPGIRITGSTPVDTGRDADLIPDDAWRLDAYDPVGGNKFEVRAICV
jgi:hypothetical protein